MGYFREHHYPNGYPQHGTGLDHVSFLLGQVLAKQEEARIDILEIKEQMAEGATVHLDLQKRMESLEHPKEKPPAMERYGKELAAILLFASMAWATGSVEKALMVLERLKAISGH